MSLAQRINSARAKKLSVAIANARREKLKGATGDRGTQGDRGIQGVQGKQGSKGTQGVQGKQGAKGKDGITTTILKEVAVDQKELLEELEELKDAYERLNNNVRGGVQGFTDNGLVERVTSNELEIKDLNEAIEILINGLLTQGVESNLILDDVKQAIEKNEEQLRLLNTRTEEAFDTKIDERDIT